MLGTSTFIEGDLTAHESWFLMTMTFLVNNSLIAVFQSIVDSGKKLTGFPFPLSNKQSFDITLTFNFILN
tara:strand:+ start:133 stop:342 length:210 start_codon:yes stop_codon:yes gene_type:complete